MIKIYKIWSIKGNKIYVGSTSKQYLSTRKADHLSKYRLQKGRRCASYELFDEYGIDACEFELIEECNQEERYNKERYWINQLKTINYIRPFSTEEEKKHQKKEWFKKDKELNPEKYKERDIIQRQKNKDYRCEKLLCDCGLLYTRIHFNRHINTKRHIDLIKKN